MFRSKKIFRWVPPAFEPRRAHAPAPGEEVRRAPIPLAALRPLMDECAEGAKWTAGTPERPGRALALPAGTMLSYPLRLRAPTRLHAEVELSPEDWRDRSGGVRGWVAATGADGRRQQIWSAPLWSLVSGSSHTARLDCDLPPDCRLLQLGCEMIAGSSSGAPARISLWHAPALLEAAASPAGRATPPPIDPARRLDPPAEPLFSVLTPVHDPPIGMLREAIDSVLAQTFGSWEMCLVDDGSQDPEVISLLQRYAAEQPARIRLVRHERGGGIAVATNTALRLARGEFIALLDHDDTLAPDALATVADLLAHEPDLDMVYSDEDIVAEDGTRIWLHLKPGWSPETICTSGYTCHLGVYRRRLALEVGGFRSELDGSQDYDFILRLVERTQRVAHIPRVLYHWRAHTRSTAGGGDLAKPYAYTAARQAIAEHLERRGIEAEVRLAPPGLYRVVHALDPHQSVAVVARLADGKECLEHVPPMVASLRAQPHRPWSLTLVTPQRLVAPVRRLLAELELEDGQAIAWEQRHPGEPVLDMDEAAAAAQGDHLLLASAPVVGLTYDWLRMIVGYSAQRDVAAAGPLAFDGAGRLIQAGVALAEGIPLHLLHGQPGTSVDDHFGFGTAVFNVLAVSGFAAIGAGTFRELHGLRSEFGEFALVDLCLRAREQGKRSVVVPDCRLRALGGGEAVNDLSSLGRLRDTWRGKVVRDPYYNAGYLQDRGDLLPDPVAAS